MKKFNSLLNSLPFQGKEATRKYGFTLVELIVAISIIAILGTIAFISLQGYSSSARDSTRISDLSAMKTSLELFHLDAGKYPETTAGFAVTYSGAEVWTQGTFGEATKINVEKLDKIPKDPLTEKEYTYSLTKTKQEFELAGLIEGDDLVLNNNKLLNQINAGETIAKAIVTGNYNGALFKAETGTTCEVLSVPSIISSQGNTQTNLIEILEDKNLVYSGYNNLPSNYKGSKYKSNGGFEFESKKLVVYSDNQECKPLYDAENSTARIQLIKNLQIAYSGTLIENSENISRLVALDVSDTQAVNILSTTLVNNNLGGELIVKKSDTLMICDEGYTYHTIRGKCEVTPTCSTGYTYSTLTKLCEKIETVTATTSAPTVCSGKFTGSNDWGLLNGNNLECSAAPNGQCSYNGSRYAIKFNLSCVIERWSRDNNWRYQTVAVGSSSIYTSSYNRVEQVYNITVGDPNCPSGYTLSGTTCSKTLTDNPTCSSGGVFNATINICQL